jgi:hypothetical protein
MEGLESQMEAASRETLPTEEKLHALNADVVQWTREKSRVHYALPKVKEFLHRANWAVTIPERKKLEEIFKNHVEPRIPFPESDKVPDLLDYLLKERQVLSAQGASVAQECQTILAGIQGALRTLRSNAAANAHKERRAARAKRKYY